MTIESISLLAILVATVVGMVTGGVWYSVLANAWMAAAGLKREDLRPSPVLYARTVLCQLVVAAVHVTLFVHLGGNTVGQGLILAGALWLGFVAAPMTVNHGFQGQSASLTVIDGAGWLAVLLLQGVANGLLAG